MNQINVLIIDDEAVARLQVRNLLSNYTNVTILAECSSGASAIKGIRTFKPDLIFAPFFLDCFTEDEVILIIDLISQWSTKTTN